MNLALFLLAGCALIVAPLHSASTTSVSIAETLPPPEPPESIIAVPATDTPPCPLYVPPQRETTPRVPDFSQEERTDPDKLNVRLVAYIGALRDYIARATRQQDDTYTDYQAKCLKPSP